MEAQVTFDIEKLIAILKKEVSPIPPDESLRRFINCGTVKFYRCGTPIIETGQVDDNLYLIVEGIYRLTWLEGQKVSSAGFGAAGSLFLSPKGFYVREQSFFSFETSTDCKIMSWKKSTVMKLIDEDHELCKWFFTYAVAQFYATETKMSTLSGSARERYEQLASRAPDQWRHIHNRPDLVKEVSSKDLASYLGITPSYLSKIRKESLKGKRRKSADESSLPQSHTHRTKAYMLELLERDPSLTCAKLEDMLGLSTRRIKEYIRDLKESGQLMREGNNRSGFWVVKKD